VVAPAVVVVVLTGDSPAVRVDPAGDSPAVRVDPAVDLTGDSPVVVTDEGTTITISISRRSGSWWEHV